MALAAVLCFTGCSSKSGTDRTAESLLGKSLGEVGSTISSDEVLLIVQDASPRFAEPPSYTADNLHDSRFTIIAACSNRPRLDDSSQIEIAVVPTDTFQKEGKERMDLAEFTDAVVCDFK